MAGSVTGVEQNVHSVLRLIQVYRLIDDHYLLKDRIKLLGYNILDLHVMIWGCIFPNFLKIKLTCYTEIR